MDGDSATGTGKQAEQAERVLRLPSIRQLKTDLQRIVWREAVNDVVRISHERPVLRRLEKLLAA